MANFFQDIIDRFKQSKGTTTSILPLKIEDAFAQQKTFTPVKELPKTLAKPTYSGNFFQDVIDKFKPVAQMPIVQPKPIMEKRVVTPPDVLGFGKGILQETAKSGGSIALTLMGKDKLEIDSSSPKWQQRIKEIIFGKEPIKSLQTRIAEGELAIKPYLKKHGLESAALPVSFVGIGLLTALDFTGVGGEKNALKALVKTTDVGMVSKILKQIGVADDLILPAAGKIAKMTDEKEIKLAIDKISALQQTTKVVPKTSQVAKPVLPQLDEMFAKEPLAKRMADKVLTFGKDTGTQWFDRLKPIQRLVNKAQEISGKTILPDNNPYVAGRIFAGVGGKIDNSLDGLGRIIRNSGVDQNDLKKFLTLERMTERASRGFKNPLELGLKESKQGLEELRMVVGDETFGRLHKTANQLYEYGDDLLRRSKDAGIIDDAAYQTIKAKNQKWTPFDVIDYLEDQTSAIPSGNKSFSVGTQDAVKKMIGTTKEIADPLESLVRRTYKVITLTERNKVAQKIVNLRKLAPELHEMIKPVKYGATELNVVPRGFEKISVFEAGTKVDYAVPQELAETIKGLGIDKLGNDMISRFISTTAKLFRMGTTTLNASFFIPNAIRDYHTAKVVSKYGFNFVDYLRGFASVISRDIDYKLWKEAGGTFATRMDVYRGYPMEKALKNVTEGMTTRTIKTIVNPFALLNTIASVVEEAPRVGVFKKALKKGAQLSEATLESRQATVDFARMGTKMRVANTLAPFLNARLQGTLNLARALKEKPVKTVTTIAYTVSIPTITAYLYNRQQEGWGKIPQWEKDNNWIITTGQFENSEGEIVPSYIKIPKGDIGRVFGNPLESLLQFIDKKDSKRLDQLALEMFSDVSPIPFYEQGKFEGGKTISSVAHPVAKTAMELATNKELFTGYPLVPSSKERASAKYQFKAGTTETAKIIGEVLNISPAKLQHGLKGVLGSAAVQPLQASDVALEKTGKIPPSKLTIKEKLMYAPVVGRFFGARGGEEDTKDLERLSDLEREATDRSIENEMKAKDIISTIKKTPKEQRVALIKDYVQKGELNDQVKDKITELLKRDIYDIEYLDRKIKALPVQERTKFIIGKIREVPKEERGSFIRELIEKDILTKNVMKEIGEQL